MTGAEGSAALGFTLLLLLQKPQITTDALSFFCFVLVCIVLLDGLNIATYIERTHCALRYERGKDGMQFDRFQVS